jgi:hypothetical protein
MGDLSPLSVFVAHFRYLLARVTIVRELSRLNNSL